MDTTSPELQELVAVIRREHRRTQIVFGISIIILCLVIMFTAPVAIHSLFENSTPNPDAAALVQQNMQPTSSVTATTSPAGTPRR